MSQDLKSEIRSKILNYLRNQKEEDKLKKSLAILDKLLQDPVFQNSRTILFYASFDGEVDTFEMIRQALKQGKRVALPTILTEKKEILPTLIENCEDGLEDGPYGIKQPKTTNAQTLAPEEIDLVIVPAVAFDKNNNRLGRGAGYYDRFLKKLPQGTPTVGLAFNFQVVECLPTQSSDIPVSRVISN